MDPVRVPATYDETRRPEVIEPVGLPPEKVTSNESITWTEDGFVMSPISKVYLFILD